jgi:glutaredoxin
VAYVLHFVPVFCPPKKRTKELVFSKKKKPYTSHLTRAKWQEKKHIKFIQFPQYKYPTLQGELGKMVKH